MFHGLGSCIPSSAARRTDPGRHTFVTLKGPSQLGERKGRPKQEEGKRGELGWAKELWAALSLFFPFLLFFFFSIPKLFKQFYLNSNKF
jgi:hypothetical protein